MAVKIHSIPKAGPETENTLARFNMNLKILPGHDVAHVMGAVERLNGVIQSTGQDIISHNGANCKQMKELSREVFRESKILIGETNADKLNSVFHNIYSLLNAIRSIRPGKIIATHVSKGLKPIFHLARELAAHLLKLLANLPHPLPEEINNLKTVLPGMIDDLNYG